MFANASSVTLSGPLRIFFDGEDADIFTDDPWEGMIPGAESDSSARDPPPRCLPGTRLGILDRCLYFIANCSGRNQIRWVVGGAGVGKSAIMQTVIESPKPQVALCVSIFFSVQGRDDGTKAIITLSYQFAVQSGKYRQVIKNEVSRDPSLLQSSMQVQFQKFIVDPFIHHPDLKSAGRILIIIDGLNECNNPRAPLELLRLISDFCIKYPSSPFVWLIASRPERHITSFFARANVKPLYEKEEIQADSDESRADVEQFLRHELKRIKVSYSLDSHSVWPEETDLRKLKNAAGGLFAYAHTVIRYIGDSTIGSPIDQFSKVLKLIDNRPMTGIPREETSTALLNALYGKILSDVPDKVNIHARKLILAIASRWFKALAPDTWNFVVLCNWLAMSQDEAYAALNPLQAVFRTPSRDVADNVNLEPFHKSFMDYVSDSSQSHFFRDIRREAQQLKAQCASRILQEAPGGIDFGDVDYKMGCGILKRGMGTADRISLAWSGDRDDKTRLIMYKMAIGEAVAGIRRGDTAFQGGFYIRLLTSRFEKYGRDFPFDRLNDLLFDEPRRRDFKVHGVLEEKPLKLVTISTIFNYVMLQFRPSATRATNLSDSWKLSCTHEREFQGEGGQDQGWKTAFWWRKEWLGCAFCSERLKHQWANWKARDRDGKLPILFTSAEACWVKIRFVDPDASEWIYGFWYHRSPEELKLYGSAV